MKKMDENDKKILTIYCQLSFPNIFYELEGLNYINSLDSMLQGCCERLLNGHLFKYVICDKEELLIEDEFHRVIEDKRNLIDVLRYYYMYKLVRLILGKYL